MGARRTFRGCPDVECPAGVAELVDALALGASKETYGGSNPLPGKKFNGKRIREN